jgi:cellulose synthase/poly-beta-1,6-N-acetylglucosamine synthase-like glycosyltransferase
LIREAIFWTAAAVLGATYVGLPAVTLLRGRLMRRPHQVAEIAPPVSVVIAAHNEAAVIGARIENLLALDYPTESLEVVIASDGSTDGTDAIVA